MKGVITAIHGDVIEVEFDNGLPNINDSLIIKKPDGTSIILEVHHDHINHTTLKAIALGFTQGLKRGMTVISSGGPLLIAACKSCLGRVFNIFGEPIDGNPSLEDYTLIPVHKAPPALEEQVNGSGILETGIKDNRSSFTFSKGG